MKRALFVILAFFGVRLAVASLYPLVPDEAYYWAWAQHPAWGYFDHPPMVAWMVLAGTWLAGNTFLGVRLLFLVASAITSLLIYAIVLSVADEKRALWALLAGSVALLFGVGSVLATPDVPLLLFWALGLWAAVHERWWLWGLAVGLGFLSKLPGLMLLALPLAHVPRARWRSVLVGLGVGFLVSFPLLMWNSQNGWPNFAFQAGHGLGGALNPKGPLKFIGDMLLVLTPPLSLYLLWGGARALGAWRDRRVRVLLIGAWLPILVFFLSSFKGVQEANWPAPGYLALLAVAPLGLKRLGAGFRASVAFAGLALGLVYAHAVHPFLPVKKDPTRQARGWREVARCAKTYAEEYNLPIVCGRYQEASLVWFYSGVETRVLGSSRPSQYDLWSRDTPTRFIYLGSWKGADKLGECGEKRRYPIYLVER